MDKGAIGTEVKRVAGLLGLEGLLNRMPRELSGGQRQRVALGRAIIRKPEVFLMDEPLSNLDARLRIEMRAELKKLHKQLKITTIYVTHDQSEAMSLSDRVAVLYDGEIQQSGTPQEIYLRPANMMVAGFVGSPPMNFIPALVKDMSLPEVDCNGVLLRPATSGTPENENVMIGIRPEELRVSSCGTDKGIEAVVSIVESAGPFNWVDLEWNGSKVKGMAGLDEKLAPGDTCYIDFPEEKILLFDEKTGRRI